MKDSCKTEKGAGLREGTAETHSAPGLQVGGPGNEHGLGLPKGY